MCYTALVIQLLAALGFWHPSNILFFFAASLIPASVLILYLDVSLYLPGTFSRILQGR